MYPFYNRIRNKVGNPWAKFIISGIVTGFSILFLLGVTLWITDALKNLYIYLDSFFSWLGALRVPQALSAVFDAMATSFPEKLRDLLLKYTLSIPKLALQLIVFLAVFYATLSNADFLAEEIYSLLPSTNRRLGEKLIEKVKETVDAILKTWLFFSIMKGMFLAIGFYIFGLSNVAGAIAAGILCAILELLPVVGGWIMWVVGAIILWHRSPLLAILFSLYGITTISPLPDYTIKPKLTKHRAKVSSVVALVGIFGGIMAFGAVGIILGPIAIGLLFALIDAWKEIERPKRLSKAHHSQDV
ncbi:hypothetical protein Py04_1461 [Pyrococcus sp. ST04]|nr:hypothetical protein Py04_1461 [Pyrococcus sp. ST04]